MIIGKQFRQLRAQVVNRNLPVYPGTPAHPQGRLLSHREGGKAPLFDAQRREAGRRRQAGENNPDAPWRTPILQHHFQPTHDKRTGRKLPVYTEQELKLR